MKKIFIFTLFVSLIGVSFAQDLSRSGVDSLYNAFIQIKSYGDQTASVKSLIPGIQSVKPDTGIIKCGFNIINQVRTHLDSFSPEQRIILQKLLSRPQTDTSFVSPSGFFKIHFSKSDYPDYVPESVRKNLSPAQLQIYKKIYLDSLAVALDSSYNFEVNYLGFPPPPSDNGAGGDDKYDIYIQNLGSFNSGLYGYTEFETELSPGSNTWTSYMVIDDDYKGYYTDRIDGARVTVAHEFHHSIQGGDYIYRDSDAFFYELTSTSMETFVYNSIHDYIDYIYDYFNNTYHSFASNSGYDLAIWNIFLKMNFGYNIIKRQWELMPKMRALNAIDMSLDEKGTNLGSQLNEFGVWTYFTGSRAVPGKYFPQAKYYPQIRPITKLQFIPPSKSLHLNSGAVSNSFILFANPSNLDTLVSLVTNADIKNGIDSLDASYQFDYSLYNYDEPGSVKLAERYNYYAKFTVAKPGDWLTSQILNNVVLQSGVHLLTQVDYAFPSPFNYSKNQHISIPVKPAGSPRADLKVYTSSMDLVYSSNLQIKSTNGPKVVEWDGRNNRKQKLSTGVYIFITKSGNKTTIGKLVIFNE